jgi:hypothetical protein
MISRFFERTSQLNLLTRALQRASRKGKSMKRILTLTLLVFCVFTTPTLAQDSTSTTKSTAKQSTKRGPVFRATKDHNNQAQSLLKSRGFYAGEQIGKLDDATREALRKYQQAEGLKITGTLNKLTLEKMNIQLTDKQKQM